mmetsp:Transcript_4558/g.12744  ORF Transcript_4558/g.12744 Transcript_4558/m.12744 type:complete len:391 (+) Transcript_4558:469-1641(+)
MIAEEGSFQGRGEGVDRAGPVGDFERIVVEGIVVVHGVQVGQPDLDGGPRRPARASAPLQILAVIPHAPESIVPPQFLPERIALAPPVLSALHVQKSAGRIEVGIEHLRRVIEDAERGAVSPGGVKDHELHGRLGPLEGVPLTLQLLDAVQYGRGPRADVGVVHGDAQALNLSHNVLPAAELGDEDAFFVPHGGRVDVLIAEGTPFHRRDVKSSLVSERRRPHEGRGAVGGSIESLVDETAEGRNVAEVGVARHAGLDVERQRGYDGAQIGVAGAFPDSVDGSLDHTRPGLGRHHRIGHGHPAVVVRVHTHRHVRELLSDLGGHLLHLPRHRSTVGIAQDQRLGARLGGGPAAFQRVGRVVLVSVVEVLQIDKHPLPLAHEVADGIANHF